MQADQLDICEQCKGAWFDRDELEALWTPRFDLALSRRNLTRRDAADATGGLGDDLVFHSLFWAPDILMHGGMLVGDAASASVSVAPSAPDLIDGMPGAAAGAFDAVGEASTSVFEAVIEIVGGIFG